MSLQPSVALPDGRRGSFYKCHFPVISCNLNLLSKAYLYLSGRVTKYIWDLSVRALPWQKQSHRATLRHQAPLANEWENKAGHCILFSDRAKCSKQDLTPECRWMRLFLLIGLLVSRPRLPGIQVQQLCGNQNEPTTICSATGWLKRVILDMSFSCYFT